MTSNWEMNQVPDINFQIYKIWHDGGLPLLSKKLDIEQNLKSPGSMIRISASTGCGKSTLLPQIIWIDRENIDPNLTKVIILEPGNFESQLLFSYSHSTINQICENQIHLCYNDRKLFSPETKGVIYTTYEKFIGALIIAKEEFVQMNAVIVLDEFQLRKVSQDAVFSFLKYYIQNEEKKNIRMVLNLPIEISTNTNFITNKIFKIEIKEFVEEVDIQYVRRCKAIEAAGRIVQVLEKIEEKEKNAETSDEPGHVLLFFAKNYTKRKVALEVREELMAKDKLKNFQVFVFSHIKEYEELHSALKYQNNKSKRILIFSSRGLESNITIPNLLYIIDFGNKDYTIFNRKTECYISKVRDISRSLAIQRLGRIGRMKPGICFRFYDQKDMEAFKKEEDPQYINSAIDKNILVLFYLFDLYFPDINSKNDGNIISLRFSNFIQHTVFYNKSEKEEIENPMRIVTEKMKKLRYVGEHGLIDRENLYKKIRNFNINQLLLLQEAEAHHLVPQVIALISTIEISRLMMFRKASEGEAFVFNDFFERFRRNSRSDFKIILNFLDEWRNRSSGVKKPIADDYGFYKHGIDSSMKTFNYFKEMIHSLDDPKAYFSLSQSQEDDLIRIYGSVYSKSLTVKIKDTQSLYCLNKKRVVEIDDSSSFFFNKSLKYFLFMEMRYVTNRYIIKNPINLSEKDLERLNDPEMIEKLKRFESLPVHVQHYNISQSIFYKLKPIRKIIQRIFKKEEKALLQSINVDVLSIIYFCSDWEESLEHKSITGIIAFIKSLLEREKSLVSTHTSYENLIIGQGAKALGLFDLKKEQFASLVIKPIKFSEFEQIISDTRIDESFGLDYPDICSDKFHQLMKEPLDLNREIFMHFSSYEEAYMAMKTIGDNLANNRAKYLNAIVIPFFPSPVIGKAFKFQFGILGGSSILIKVIDKPSMIPKIASSIQSNSLFQNSQIKSYAQTIRIENAPKDISKEDLKKSFANFVFQKKILLFPENQKEVERIDVEVELARAIDFIRRKTQLEILKFNSYLSFGILRIYATFSSDASDEQVMILSGQKYLRRKVYVRKYSHIREKVYADKLDRIKDWENQAIATPLSKKQFNGGEIIKLRNPSYESAETFLGFIEGAWLPLHKRLIRADLRLLNLSANFRKINFDIWIYDKRPREKLEEVEQRIEFETQKFAKKFEFKIPSEAVYLLSKNGLKIWNQKKHGLKQDSIEASIHLESIVLTKLADSANPVSAFKKLCEELLQIDSALPFEAMAKCKFCYRDHPELLILSMCNDRICPDCLRIFRLCLEVAMTCPLCGTPICLADFQLFFPNSQIRAVMKDSLSLIKQILPKNELRFNSEKKKSVSCDLSVIVEEDKSIFVHDPPEMKIENFDCFFNEKWSCEFCGKIQDENKNHCADCEVYFCKKCMKFFYTNDECLEHFSKCA